MNCSRILGKYRLQYDFDEFLSGNAEQYGGPLSMGWRVRPPCVSGSISSIRLDGRTGLGLLGSIFVHVVVIFGIGFIAVQEKPGPILPALRVTLINTQLERPEEASFISLGPGILIIAPG